MAIALFQPLSNFYEIKNMVFYKCKFKTQRCDKIVCSWLHLNAVDVHKFVKVEQSYELLVSNSNENMMMILEFLVT